MYSLDSYRSVLSHALAKGYRFASFLDEVSPETGRIIYLRHDVDVSPALALKVAEANHALGVRGTFFVQLRSRYYNLYDQQTRDCISAIHALGQYIGFHYASPSAIADDPSVLAALVQADFATFAQEVPETLPVFSWHNTTPQILEWGKEHNIPGLVSVYARRFFSDIPYYSDSLGRHTPTEFLAIFDRDHPALQLLLHPDIWGRGGRTLAELSAGLWGIFIRDHDMEADDPGARKLLPYRIPDDVLAETERLLIERGAPNSPDP